MGMGSTDKTSVILFLKRFIADTIDLNVTSSLAHNAGRSQDANGLGVDDASSHVPGKIAQSSSFAAKRSLRDGIRK